MQALAGLSTGLQREAVVLFPLCPAGSEQVRHMHLASATVFIVQNQDSPIQSDLSRLAPLNK